MKILYLHQYFRTPNQGGGIRSWLLSKELLSYGHEVTIITGGVDKIRKVSEHGGLTIIELPVEYSHFFPFWKRIFAFLKFVRLSCTEVLKHEADIVFATSTPITIAIPAIWYKLWKKKPYIFEIRDIWPDAAVAVGSINNKWLIGLMRFMEQWAYKEAIAIVALSPDIKHHVTKYFPNKRIEVIPNMAQTDFFYPRTSWKPAPFILSYIGTVGPANDLASYIPLLLELEASYPAQFELVIMGEGLLLNDMIQKLKANEHSIKFTILPKSDKAEVKKLLQASTFTIVSFINAPEIGAGSPNKFFDALASGVPVLINVVGWLHKKVLEYKLGLVVTSGNEKRTAHKMMAIARNEELWTEISENGQYSAINYTPKKAGKALHQLLESIKN